MLNDDGISVKGCQIIYAPAGQAGEYSPLAVNPYSGCGHKCAYCYVPQVIHMTREKFDQGATLRKNFIQRLTSDAIKYQEHGIHEQVMLSFTTDPYHLGDTSATRTTLEILRDHGLGFCTLTKGGTRALRDIDLFRADRDAFACTITSLNPDFSRQWERAAATPQDRIEALIQFHEAGIFTWVSLEPTLSTGESLAIIEAIHPYVDLFKIGRTNYVPSITKTTDWQHYTEQIIQLCKELGANHYIKKDLQPYLPAGYPNPMRVEQHHGSK